MLEEFLVLTILGTPLICFLSTNVSSESWICALQGGHIQFYLGHDIVASSGDGTLGHYDALSSNFFFPSLLLGNEIQSDQSAFGLPIKIFLKWTVQCAVKRT